MKSLLNQCLAFMQSVLAYLLYFIPLVAFALPDVNCVTVFLVHLRAARKLRFRQALLANSLGHFTLMT